MRQAVAALSPHDKQAELRNCCEDDIYMLVTAIPNEIAPPVPSSLVRAETIVGFYVIGKCATLPAHRQGLKHYSSGCYIHAFQEVDIKLNSWLMRNAINLVAGTMVTWGEDFRNYMNENKDKLEAAVRDGTI